MNRGRIHRSTTQRGRRPIAAMVATATIASGLTIVATPVEVAFAAVLTVTTTQNVQNPLVESPLQCSLQEALTNAQADAQVYPDCPAGSGADVIEFDIPGTGPFELDLSNSSGFGALSGTITIDATTQTGWSPTTPQIVLDGQSFAGPIFDLLATTNATIKGFSLVDTDDFAGEFDVLVRTGVGSTIENNWIGVAPNGTIDDSFGSWGVDVQASTVDFPVTIAGNVIAGHERAVSITGADADDVLVVDNHIGVDVTGNVGLGNANGIVVVGPESPQLLTGLRIESNLVSANSTGGEQAGYGIRIEGNVAFPEIVANTLGTDVDGADPLPNDIAIGIGINDLPNDQVSNAAIGTAPIPLDPEDPESPFISGGNRIAGNHGAAVVLGPGSRFSSVQYNTIGLDNDSGVLPNNSLGDIAAPYVAAEGDIVIDGSSDNVVGGLEGAGNTIATVGNISAVRILAGARNRVIRNDMDVVNGLGIDLGDVGVTANDEDDADAPWEGLDDDPAFANNLQNHPEIVDATLAADTLQVTVALGSATNLTHYPVDVDLYAADGLAGARYLATVLLELPGLGTIGVGSAAFLGIAAGTPITAIAIDDLGNTSEFAPSLPVTDLDNYLVNSTGDEPDNGIDGICETELGECTLRAAIEESNAAPGTNTIRVDYATLADNGPAPYVIAPIGQLPAITDKTVLDARPADLGSWDGVPLVEIQSQPLGSGGVLDFGSSVGSEVYGLAIHGSANGSAIVAGDDMTVADSYLGLTAAGTNPLAPNQSNGAGVFADSRSSVTVRGNVISGNGIGVQFTGDFSGLTIDQNRIGTTPDGTSAVQNGKGIVIDGSASGILIADNVISGNGNPGFTGYGISLGEFVDGATVQGNSIGVAADGLTALPNDVGIVVGLNGLDVLNVLIGGVGEDAGNIISGNRGEGISLWGGSQGTTVHGNLIGVAANGSPLPNNSNDTFAFADVPGDGNVVIRNFASDNVIGGTAPGQGNVIGNSPTGAGVTIYSGVRNQVAGNRFGGNAGIAIDLGGDNVTPNDPADIDGGTDETVLVPNRLLNVPVLDSTATFLSQLSVAMTVDIGGAYATYPIRFDLYEADTDGEPTTFLGSDTLFTEATEFDFVLDDYAAKGVAAGDRLVAIAMDANGNTSEVSAPLTLSLPGTFVVDSTGDDQDLDPGDGLCADEGGVCTLRAAIEEANATAAEDTIAFGFPGTDPITITPGTLPNITTPVVIDGLTAANTSCASWPPQLRVEIDASGSSFAGLFVDGVQGRLELRGVVLNGSPLGGAGYLVWLGANTQGSEFRCNFFGTDTTGTTAVGTSTHQVFANGNSGNMFGGVSASSRNLFSGNSFGQLWLPSSDDNVIVNNYFGTDVTGAARVGSTIASAISTSGSRNEIGLVAEGAFGNLFAYSTASSPVVEVWRGGAPWPTGNRIRGNRMFGNAGIGIDLNDNTLASTGVTFNHVGALAGPNEWQNYPVLTVAQVSDSGTRVAGYLDTPLEGVEDPGPIDYVIDVYANSECDATFFGEGEQWLGEIFVTAFSGRVFFDEVLDGVGGDEPSGITATATNLDTGSTSEFSYCRPASTPNTNWVQAQGVTDGSVTSQYLVERGMEKWFRFPAGPGADVTVTLNGLPGSAVSIHTDPNEAFNAANNPTSAVQLAAEAADVSFLPSGSLPSGSLPSGSLPSGSLPSGSLPSGSLETGFLPSGSLPSGSLPSGSLPSGSLPSGSLPSGSLPSGSLPSGSLPSGSLPSGSLPSGSLPSGSLPSGSLPSGSLPSGSLPSAYGTAARRSLLAFSADPYATTQTISRNTFDYAGEIWVRVVGPYSTTDEFTLDVDVRGGVCSNLGDISGGPVPTPPGAGLQTVILTDSSRLTGTSAEITEALADLARFAARPDVQGVVVDLAAPAYARVQSANAAADAVPNCALGKNQVAEEIKAVVDAHRTNNPELRFVVLAGGADVIPFHQVSDVGGLANEREYVPPVAPNTPSDAGLRSGLVKGQDFYGSAVTLTVAGRPLAVPDLAVGRLVDGAADISLAIEAYEATGGVVNPSNSMVTGYDFVGDAAQTIADEFVEGISSGQVTFIQPPGQPPTGPDAWTADDIRPELLSGDNDVIMLTGHFSAGKLLAADYRTTILASEIQQAAASYADTIVLALGCHGGFTIPSTDLLDGASPDPDWAKAFLRKGAASFIAATGYAYGDTELEEYGERLFIELTREMRRGTGPISMGEALVAAKQAYLEGVPQLSGLDEKTLVEMTLYGLPMMKVDVPGTRLPARSVPQIVGGTTAVGGTSTGLRTSPVTISPEISTQTVELDDLENGGTVLTQYSTGRDGVVAVPFQPVLPKQIDGVDASGQVLRGVALRGGTYTDQSPVVPFTSAPAIEVSRPITSFQSDVFVPTQVWSPNYYGAVDGRATRLVTIPQQYRSNGVNSVSGTLRTWSDIDLQLYYLPDDWPNSTDDVVDAAVGPAPVITGASGDVEGDSVTFTVNAQADGSAGVQAVWILYTGEPGSPWYGRWVALDLTQVEPDGPDPTLWSGTLPLGGGDADDLRFMVQAVGGAGLTTLDTNLGAFYRVGVDNAPPVTEPPTTVTISAPGSTVYGSPQAFSATATRNGQPLAGAVVDFEVAGQRTTAIAGTNGVATVSFTPLGTPGDYDVTATVRGTPTYFGATASQPLSLLRAPTTLVLTAPTAPQPTVGVSGVSAQLSSGDLGGLGGKPVVFTLTSPAGAFERVIITDAWGTATLGDTGLPAGTYQVSAAFGGAGAVAVEDVTFLPSTSATASLVLADLTAPTITAAATVTGGQPYVADTWTTANVTVSFTCADVGGSGIASCTTPQTVSTEGVTPSVTGTAVDGAGLTTTTTFGPVKIDRTAPVITVTTPAMGASYPVGAVVNAAYGCVDAGVGGGTCVGTVATGQPIDTVTPGPKTFSVTATDALGNTTTRDVAYTVAAANTAPVVVADMGVPGLQEIGFRGNVVLITGTFTDPDGTAPYRATAQWTTGGPFTPFAIAANGQIAAAFVYGSSGVRTVTIRVCDAANNCGTDTITVRSGITQKVTPVLQCVTDRGSRVSPRYVATFGYNNPAPFAVAAPTIPLLENTVFPLPTFRGQPQVFLPGNQRNVFTAGFPRGTLTWTLHGTTVTARTNTTRC